MNIIGKTIFRIFSGVGVGAILILVPDPAAPNWAVLMAGLIVVTCSNPVGDRP